MKKTKITVRTDQVRVVRRRRSCGLKWCEPCAAPVEMLSPEEAAVVSGLSLRAIFRQVEANQIHFTETLDGMLWICFNSLLDQVDSNSTSLHRALENQVMTSDASAHLDAMFDAARDLIIGYRSGKLSAPHVNPDDRNPFREFIVGLLAERYPQESRELLRSIVERELHRPTTRLG